MVLSCDLKVGLFVWLRRMENMLWISVFISARGKITEMSIREICILVVFSILLSKIDLFALKEFISWWHRLRRLLQKRQRFYWLCYFSTEYGCHRFEWLVQFRQINLWSIPDDFFVILEVVDVRCYHQVDKILISRQLFLRQWSQHNQWFILLLQGFDSW